MNVHGVFQVLSALHDVCTGVEIKHLHDTHADAKLIATRTRAMRDQIFQLRQLAKILVETYERSPRLCAGVMLLIELRMQYIGVVYELFDEIPDKQFVIEAAEYIHQHNSAMLKALPGYDIGEVIEMVQAYEQLDDLKYLIEHHDHLVRLDVLPAQVHTAGTRQRMLGLLAVAGVSLAAAMTMLSPWLALVPIVAAVAVASTYVQQQDQLGRQRDDLIKKNDGVRLRALLGRYKSVDIAKREYEMHHRVVKAFFGDISPSQHLTGVFAVIQMELGVSTTTVNVHT